MDYDSDLARAIALSLQGQQVSGSPAPHDEVDGEELRFQADLQQAIEASRANSNAPRATTQSQTPNDDTRASMSSTSQSASQDFLSQRRTMESERLARLARRRGEQSTDSLPNKRRRLSATHADGGERSRTSSSSTSGREKERPPNATLDPRFWDGELRPTANRYCQPRKDGKPTFRLTEILGSKSEISFAIISTYAVSISWIYEFFEPRTPVIIATQPDASGQSTIKNVLPNWVMTTPFLRGGRGCQHMKFMLIFYKDGRLRAVVSTANLVMYDWSDIENAVWLQDVPKRDTPIPHDPKVIDDFPSLVQNVLKAVNVSAALANMLTHDHPNLPIQSVCDLRSKWDWSKVTAKLIPSIAGKHDGWPAVVLSGHTRLMKAVRELGLRTGKGKAAKELVIECQGSSIGNYSTQWLNEFHHSARGESADDWLDEPKARRAKLPWPPMKILFPSLQRVKQTVLGEAGGGTMFCRTNQWGAAKFPKELFYDSVSVGGEVLMHTKMIVATFCQKQGAFSKFRTPEPAASSSGTKGKGAAQVVVVSDSETEPEDGCACPPTAGPPAPKQPLGWAYVGSHNFSPSAWGTLSGSGFNPVLNINNYELGILFPLYSEQEIEKVSCFERPPRKYVLGRDRPWIQEESEVFQTSAS